MNRLMISLLACTTLAGCSEAPDQQVLSVALEQQPFEHRIYAKGELEAVDATTVSVPSSLRGPQSLLWVADNYSLVKQGQVIARLDPQRQQMDADLARFEVDKLAIDIQLQQQKDGNVVQQLQQDKSLTLTESELAQRFFSDDPRVYSRIEVIDNMRNQEYLGAKYDYLNWDESEQSSRSKAEQQLIALKQQGHQNNLDVASANLTAMEVIAPSDGLFIVGRGWNSGAPMAAGDMVWAGMPIGQIPNLTQMKAKFHVLESEAAGLKVGLPVEVRLDAYPDRLIQGEVSQVDALAVPKDKDSPVNYFGFTVTLAHTDTSYMMPGREVQGQVIVNQIDQAISVPNQALYQKEGESWLFVKRGDRFEKQRVESGERSLNRTVITQGVKPGDVVALTEPKSQSSGQGAQS